MGILTRQGGNQVSNGGCWLGMVSAKLAVGGLTNGVVSKRWSTLSRPYTDAPWLTMRLCYDEPIWSWRHCKSNMNSQDTLGCLVDTMGLEKKNLQKRCHLLNTVWDAHNQYRDWKRGWVVAAVTRQQHKSITSPGTDFKVWWLLTVHRYCTIVKVKFHRSNTS